MSTGESGSGRDWLAVAGVLLLASLTAAIVALYRSVPQTIEEARNNSVLAARPSAYGPRLDAARERLSRAEAAVSQNRDSLAMTLYSEAADHALQAKEAARSEPDSSAATLVWGRSVLGSAALLQQAGTGRGLRPDDHDTLREALGMVDQVLASSASPELQEQARTRRDELVRELRVGPMEWLPAR